MNESAFQHTSLNEKIQPEKKEVHKMFATKPLKDLIDLNKRFVFVKELFNGDGEGFSKTVSIIDSFSDFNSAQIFVEKEISSAYLWDPNAQSTRLFMKLVKQKFGEE